MAADTPNEPDIAPQAAPRSSSSSSSSSASSDKSSAPKLPRGRHFWVVPGGSRVCPGVDDRGCNLASDGSGQAGLADDTGLCVFCSSARLKTMPSDQCLDAAAGALPISTPRENGSPHRQGNLSQVAASSGALQVAQESSSEVPRTSWQCSKDEKSKKKARRPRKRPAARGELPILPKMKGTQSRQPRAVRRIGGRPGDCRSCRLSCRGGWSSPRSHRRSFLGTTTFHIQSSRCGQAPEATRNGGVDFLPEES